MQTPVISLLLRRFRRTRGGWPAALLLALLLALGAGRAARAQVPAWQAALANTQVNAGSVTAQATAVNAAGDMFVTGYFSGQPSFGGTVLTSAGGQDVFVAKWNTTSQTWAWAVAAGGTSGDYGTGIAVSGSSVYLTGYFANSSTNANSVSFGGTVLNGMGSTATDDVFVGKYTDAGTSATFGWVRAGGGTGVDRAQGIAVSGSSVYLTGSFFNTTTNANSVSFGGTTLNGKGSTATQPDIFVAKYTDAGTSATFGWARADGGTDFDTSTGIAASGSSVYLTGYFANATTNASSVTFGGTVLNGMSSTVTSDVFVAKYTDAGTSASLSWARAAGGTGSDIGNGIAVSGSSVYLTGSFVNTTTNANSVSFGGTVLNGMSSMATSDVFVAKYTDAGTSATFGWVRAGGGTGIDRAQGIAVSGSSVYVEGYFQNSTTNANSVTFGGTVLNGMSSTASTDIFVAKYTDAGTSATFGWAQAGGGTSTDFGQGIAVSSTSVYVALEVNSGMNSLFGSVPVRLNAGTVAQLNPATGACQAVSATLLAGTMSVRTTAVNAAGEVFVTGSFIGEVRFGSTVLASGDGSSSSTSDIFVAKWNPTSQSWTWAVDAGGTGNDEGQGIAVSGSSVYLTGTFNNSSTNANSVSFGGTALNGMGSTAGQDMFVAKYTDAGASATFDWARAGGGTGIDQGFGIAVSGSSVYLTGYFQNSTTNANSVSFGGTVLNGTSSTTTYDVFVAKYTDAGTSATFGWARAAGGTGFDQGQGIAVSGSSVYLTGYFANSTTNANSVSFGGTALNGMSSTAGQDVFVAKYTDAGTSATFGWAQAGGGTSTDIGQGIAVSGTSVYLTGYFRNSSTNANGVSFGGTALNGMSSSASNDIFVAKYTDAGTSATFGWAQAGGGTGTDQGFGIAVSGTSVYLTGYFLNSSTNANGVSFGGTVLNGVGSSASNDIFVVKYTDAGTSATVGWAQAGGGTGNDEGNGIAVNGSSVYLGGVTGRPATYGTIALTGGGASFGLVAALAPTPSLTSLSPTSGAVGTSITLTGTDFTGATGIRFNGTAAVTFSVSSATTATATVPAGATTGNVTITTLGGPSNGVAFGVTTPLAVSSLAPARNARAVARATDVGITFNQALNPATAGAVRVFSAQRGGQLVRGGNATASGSTLTVNPANDLRPGEVLRVSIPPAVQSATGTTNPGHVYEFTAAAVGTGPGYFLGNTNVGVGNRPQGVGVADVDGDGDLDMLTANNYGNSVSVRINDGSGAFSGGTEVAVGSSPISVKAADVDGDGDLDLLTANSGGNSVSVRLNNGSGAFSGSSDVAVGALPYDVVAADVDGDGDLDLLTANYYGNSVSVRINIGNGVFAGTDAVAVGSFPNSVATADVDGDGDLDILAANRNGNTVSVRFNNGSGFFSGTANVATASEPYDVAAADVDGDGDLDMLVANYNSSNIVSIFFNSGSGVFAGRTDVAVGSYPVSVATADVDSDGDLDMLTANSGGNTVSVRLNNGSGVFAGTANVAVGSFPCDVVAADVDGDGDLDLLTANQNGASVSVRLNQVPPPAPTLASLSPASGLVGISLTLTGTDLSWATGIRFNGTPATTFSVTSATTATATVPAAATTGPVTITTPTGTSNGVVFTVVPPLLVSSLAPARNARAVARATDVGITFNRALNPATAGAVRVFSAQRGGQLVRGGNATASGSTLTVNPADDLRPGEVLRVSVPAAVQSATGTAATGHVFELTAAVGGTGGGNFGSPGTDVPVGNSYDVAAADVDGDGDLDILAASYGTNAVDVRLNDGSGTFSGSTSVAVGRNPSCLAVADVDGDGDLDLLVGNESSGTVSVRLNDGSGAFLGSTDVPVNGTPGSLTAADMDGDGDLDMLVSLSGDEAVSLRFNDGNGVFSGTGTVYVGTYLLPRNYTCGVAAADVDGDGDLDMVVPMSSRAVVSVFRNNGSGSFVSRTDVGVSDYCNQGVTMADVDGDNDLDILVGTNYTVDVCFNNGSGVFSSSGYISVGSYPSNVAAADVDSDGDLDVLVANYGSNTVSMRLNNGSGQFSGGSTLAVGNYPRRVALADVDGDGDLDLLTTSTSGVNVRLNQPPVPVLLSFSPGRGPVGTSVTVTGEYLGSASAVRVHGTAGTITANTATSLTFVVGAGSSTGIISLTTPLGTASSSTPFIVGSPVALALTGFNADVVAEGTGSAATLAPQDVDGGGYALMAAGYTNPGGSTTTRGLPANGQIVSATGSGVTYNLAPYTGPNDLRLPSSGSGTLTLAQPQAGRVLYVLAASANGMAYTTATVTFADNSTQTISGQFVSDWYWNGGFAIQGLGRVLRSTSAIDNDAGNPRLYEVALAIDAANAAKPIASVQFTNTAGSGVMLNVMGLGLLIEAPALASLSVPSGLVGSSLTLTGTGFSGAIGISFNGTPAATFSVSSATTATATVPVGASTGPVTISTPGGTSNGLAFAVTTAAPPLTLTALSPAAELPGQAVVLTGTGFTAGSSVSFGGVAASSVTYTSATRLTAVVPVGATPGSAAVVVSDGSGSSSSSPAFEVLQVYRDTAPSGCLSTDPLTLTGSGGPGTWRYLRLPGAGGAVVAAIEDTQNLGTVVAGLAALGTATAAPVQADAANRRYLDRNFYLTATNPSFAGQTVRVRFFGLTSELTRLAAMDGNATLAGLNTSQYDGPNVNCVLADNDPTAQRRLLPAPATVAVGADWFAAQLTVADHFSEFYLTGASAPLPVELLSFTAQAEGNAVQLQWRTASERNSARWHVERSPDGRAYTKIAALTAAGTTTQPTEYQYRDLPISPSAMQPITYYRLQQEDADGTRSYSPVRAIRLTPPAQPALTLSPNPARSTCTVQGAGTGQAVRLLDALGRTLTTATADATGSARLVLPAGLAAGVYVVRTGSKALRLAVE